MRKQVLKLMMTALLIAFVVPLVNAQVHVGDILCEGDKVVSPADYDSLDVTAIGVVFYVDNSGEHGWVVALDDDGLFSWGGYGEDTDLENYSRKGSASNDTDGLNNTKTIRESGEDYPAFYAVDFENGWYLPAIGQLKQLYKNLEDVNPGLAKVGGSTIQKIGWNYWSSTEYSENDAWYLTSIGGPEHTANGYNDNKDACRLVRSIRDF